MISDHLINDQVKPFNNKDNKTKQLITLFNSISKEYDLFNLFTSLGLACHWRKKSIQLLKNYPANRILDVATGTADMCLLLAQKLHAKHILGVDVAEEMLKVGKQKVSKHQLNHLIDLEVQDSSNLSFDSNQFDIVTISFGIRNLEKLSLSLTQIYRVLKPGGVFLIIEVNEPEKKWLKWFYTLYIKCVIHLSSILYRKDKRTFQYLASSMAVFPNRKSLIELLQFHGFKHLATQKFTLEVCTAYLMQKPLHL